MDYQLVVFDLAGTTVKDNKDIHRVLQSVLHRYDVDASIDEINEVMGIPKPVAIFKLLRKTCDAGISDTLVDEIHRQFVNEMITFYENDASVGEKPGVSETFHHLKTRGIKVAVDTGFDRKITDALLNRLGWRSEKLIDCSVTSDEVALGRPYPDMIFKAMKKTGTLNPKRVVKVGDTASDIQQGRAAACGMIVGVTTGAFTADDLKIENPHYLIKEVTELPALIG